MNARIFTAVVLAAAIAAPSLAFAQATQGQGQSQSKPDPKPEPKPESKPDPKAPAAPSLAGKWNVTVESPNGTMQSALDLKVDGKKLAGILSSQMGEAPIEGELGEASKLTFWMTMDAGGQQISITFTGAVQKDGSMTGTLNFGQGEIPWTAVRAK